MIPLQNILRFAPSMNLTSKPGSAYHRRLSSSDLPLEAAHHHQVAQPWHRACTGGMPRLGVVDRPTAELSSPCRASTPGHPPTSSRRQAPAAPRRPQRPSATSTQLPVNSGGSALSKSWRQRLARRHHPASVEERVWRNHATENCMRGSERRDRRQPVIRSTFASENGRATRRLSAPGTWSHAR